MILNFKNSWENSDRKITPVHLVNYDENSVRTYEQGSFAASAPTNFIKASTIATPTVVNIQSTLKGDFDVWGMGAGKSSGSGVIISKEGYIITNRHVIDNAKSLLVTLSDNREFKAEIIGQDPSTDIALLKIKSNNLPFITFGNSDSLQVGEWVLAVGFGRQNRAGADLEQGAWPVGRADRRRRHSCHRPARRAALRGAGGRARQRQDQHPRLHLLPARRQAAEHGLQVPAGELSAGA